MTDRTRASQAAFDQPPPPGFSLLWPNGHTPATGHTPLDPNTVRDLEIERTIAGLITREEYRSSIARILSDLCTDPEVIRYRQDILDDLLHHPSLVVRLDQLLPALDSLAHNRVRVVKDLTALHEVVWRASELETIVESVQSLSETFAQLGDGLISTGLRQLCDTVAAMAADPTFQHLVQALPDLLAQLRLSASVTIGVNLDHNLRPVEATLLAASAEGLNASTAGDSRVISMVSSPIQEEEPGEGVAGLRRSYRVVVGPPMGRSYATEIATRFGVGYEQLYAMLQARGVITPAGQDETAAAS